MMKRTISIILLGAAQILSAAPSDTRLLHEMRADLSKLYNEVRNHEEALRVMEEKCANQEVILESFNKSIDKSRQSSQGEVKKQVSSVESKLKQMESHIRDVSADLRTVHQHVSESTDKLNKCLGKLSQLEAVVQKQGENEEHMRSAMAALIEALQVSSPIAEGKVYQVKEGDTLGMIAVKHKTTVKVLKEVNQLTSDRIHIGQMLKMP